MEKEALSTIEHKGKTIKTYYDEDNFNPRKEYDNLGVIYSNGRTFNPDGKSIEELIEAAGVDADEVTVVPWDAIAKKFIYLKVWIYEHSLVALRTGDSNPFSCPWDSGLAGVIAITKEQARKEYRVKRLTKKVIESIQSAMEGEIEELEHYMNGEKYRYEILDENGDEWDACGNFLEEEAAIDEAKGCIDYAVKQSGTEVAEK